MNDRKLAAQVAFCGYLLAAIGATLIWGYAGLALISGFAVGWLAYWMAP